MERYAEWDKNPHTGGHGAMKSDDDAAGVRESIRYLHRDHLGSVRAVTDADGTVVARAAYDPFDGRRPPDGAREADGAERAAATGDAALDPARGFTGHEQLDRLGRVHVGGRVHDPRLGRFLSPDPVVGNPGSSQCWHACSYAGNCPMSFTDPTGLIRAPMPWEHDMCAGGTRCRNLNGGGGGGFGSGTARVEGSRSYVYAGVSTFFFPSRGWGFDGDRRDGSDVVTIAYFFSGSVPTFTDVAVPAEKQPGDRPIQIEVGDVAGTVVDFIPIVGDAKAFYEAYNDPTPINVTVGVIGVFGPVGDAAGKALKAAHAAYKSQKAAMDYATVIGRTDDLKDATKLRKGKRSLLERLPNQGSRKANWKQNSGVLRQEMRRGKPIRDVSPENEKGAFSTRNDIYWTNAV